MSRLRLALEANPGSNPPASSAEVFGASAWATKRIGIIDENGVFQLAGQPLIARRVSAVAIANTETQVLGVTVPANWMAAGTTFRVTAFGRHTSGVTPGSSIFRVRIGTTTLTGNIPATLTILNGTSKTNAPFYIDALVTIRAGGASGTAIGNIIAIGGVAVVTFGVADEVSAVSATVVVDTTADKIVELTYISGAAGTTATFENAAIELLGTV